MSTTASSPRTDRLRALPTYELIRHDGEERTYSTPEGRFPSVTTVLSGSRDTSGLDEWRESVGEARAAEITHIACTRGTRHHEAIETFLKTGAEPPFNFLTTPFWKSTRDFVTRIEHPLLMEAPIWHPDGYAGTIDCVAYLPESGPQPALLDWKTASKPCKPFKLYEYSIQLGAYTAALNHVYRPQGLQIAEAYLVVALPNQTPQIEHYTADALHQLFRHFQARLQNYTYTKHRKK